MMLNLKSLNQHIDHQHFKMDLVWTAIRLTTPNCYMVSIFLKNTYYSVSIAKPHQNYLKLKWNMLFKLTCFPNGSNMIISPLAFSNSEGASSSTLEALALIVTFCFNSLLLITNLIWQWRHKAINFSSLNQDENRWMIEMKLEYSIVQK